ncbi:hypothetical protein C8J57DRAFT_1500997 [Mycena rebaudengoi]|nr:hypothetical protein C8J57DRAFT_1500997 [Mycena rebaudengoi]
MDNKSTPLSSPSVWDSISFQASRNIAHKSIEKRFLQGLGLVLILWSFSTGLHLIPHWKEVLLRSDSMPWPIPPDVSVDYCTKWSPKEDSGEYSSDARFELPMTAETLFLLARSELRSDGIFASGKVHYSQSQNASGLVSVHITASSFREESLEATQSCLVRREGNQTGVGIFAKWEHDHPPGPHARVRFEVDVVFPRAPQAVPLAVNNFWTDVEIFSQSVEDLGGILFKTISLKSILTPIIVTVLRAEDVKIANTVGLIRIESLSSARADITTSAAGIEGQLNISDTVILETSSSPINVNLNLVNGAERNITKARFFGVVTAVAANITLDSPKKSRAAFDILTLTSFGALRLDVLSAPVDSNLTLAATTSFQEAIVALPETYEGSFLGLTSPHSHARVEYDQARRDRKLEYDDSRPGSVRGNIFSAPEGKTRGAVNVTTSLGPVVLRF